MVSTSKEEAEAFVRKQHHTESCRYAGGHAQAAAAPYFYAVGGREGGEGGRGRPSQETEVWVWTVPS